MEPADLRTIFNSTLNGDRGDDWDRIPLDDIARNIRTGNYTPTIPTILDVEHSHPLLYPERINQIFGESAGGKTWIAIAALHHVVARGQHGLLVDYEDAPNTTTERLINAGYTDHEIALVDYRNPTTGLGHGLEHIATDHPYGICIFDSTGEALAAGHVGNDDDEIAGWFQHMVKPYTQLPGRPAVLLSDHVPKDPNAPKLYAIMSQRKRAAVTGAAYRVDTLTAFAKGRDGKLKLTVAKDRLGTRPMGSIAAIVDINTTPNGTISFRFHLSDSQIAAETGQPWRPTIYMERVSRWLEFHPGSSQRAILDGCEGRKDVITLAVETLIAEGWVTVITGPRGAQLHTVNKPYTEALEPVDNTQKPSNTSPFPTASDRVPGRGTESHCDPPSLTGGGHWDAVADAQPRPAVDNSPTNTDYDPTLWPDGTPSF